MKILLTILTFALFQTIGISQADLVIQKSHSETIEQVEFSKSGRYLVSLALNNEFIIWDLFHDKSIATFELSTIEDVQGLKFTADEKELQVKTKRTTYFYDLAKESLREEEDNLDTNYRDKTGYVENEYTLYLRKGAIIKKTNKRKVPVYRVAINYAKVGFVSFDVSPDKKWLIGVTASNAVYVYYYFTGIKRKELFGHNSDVLDVRFAADGKTFATTGKDRSIIIWDTETFKIKKRLYSRIFKKKSVAFSPDGNHIYTGDELGYIYDFNMADAFPTLGVYQHNFQSINQILARTKHNDYLIASEDNSVYKKTSPTDQKELERYKLRGHEFLDVKSVFIERYLNTYQPSFGKTAAIELSPSQNQMVFFGDSKFPGITYVDFNDNKEKRFFDHYQFKDWIDVGMPTDSSLIALQDSSFVLHHWRKTAKKWQTKTDSLSFLIKDFEILTDSTIWLNTKYSGQYLYNINSRRKQKLLDMPAYKTFKRKNYIILQSYSNSLIVYDLKKAKIIERFIGHRSFVTDVAVHPKGDRIVSSSEDGTIKLWSLKGKGLLSTIIPFQDGEFIFITSDNYYLMTKGAISEIGFKKEGQYFYPDQFDLRYNRPDIVLASLGFTNKDLIAAYRKAYIKRLKKMNFDENDIRADFHLPELELTNIKEIPKVTAQEALSVKINATDNQFELDRINVWVNNVSLYGTGGIDLRSNATKAYTTELKIPLLGGINKVQISVLNSSGVESYKQSFTVEKNGNTAAPNLYVASLGISKYEDGRYDLTYADKDARDIATVFKPGQYFGNVNSLVLTNEQVTRTSLLQVREFILQAKTNDVVLLFIAGHGVLDEEFDYYFASHDIDFDNPSGKGISYEMIEKLLDGIPAIRKLLFMDTCHSGEVDKEDVEFKVDEEESVEGIEFRNVGVSIQNKENPLGLKSTNELMRSLFTDLRRGTGATVISSSSGTEFSFEGDEFQNGLFTYCLLEGLKTGAADINKDKMISVSELRTYMQNRVNELSQGLQTPTSRLLNTAMDYRIW